jgi:DNA-directed RNA polymerase specialized sigma24 family protein
MIIARAGSAVLHQSSRHSKHGLESPLEARVQLELVQETFAQAPKKIVQFRGQSEGEFVNWLQRIFRNKVIDKIREAAAAHDDIRRE